MKVKVYKISNPDSCVTEIIEVKSDKATDNLTHFVPPFGNPEIILYIGHTHQIKNVACAKGLIKGHYNISQKIDFIKDYHFLSIRLQPYGLKQLFNIKPSELLNSVLDIEGHPFLENLLSFFKSRKHPDVSLMKKILSFLEQYSVYSVSESTKEFVKIASENKIKTIKDVVFDNGTGLRTLQRNFRNEVGLSPKEYLRIIRLNAIEQKMSQTVNVFEIIADFDFTDQSHYIKDYKLLRNYTPAEIIKKKLLLTDQLAVPEIRTI